MAATNMAAGESGDKTHFLELSCRRPDRSQQVSRQEKNIVFELFGFVCLFKMYERQTRKHRVTYSQLKLLWEFLNNHREVAVGVNKSTQDREHAKKMWKTAAIHLNCLGEGPIRSASEWSKYWVDYKAKLKRKNRILNETSRTGADPCLDELSELELKFLTILETDKPLSQKKDTPEKPVPTGLPGVQVQPKVTSNGSSDKKVLPTIRLSQNHPKLLVAGKNVREALDSFTSTLKRTDVARQPHKDVDDCHLYAQLLAMKLRKMSEEKRLKLMHDIDGMFLQHQFGYQPEEHFIPMQSSPSPSYVPDQFERHGNSTSNCSDSEVHNTPKGIKIINIKKARRRRTMSSDQSMPESDHHITTS